MLVSTPVFVLVWLWSIKRGIEVSWTLGGLGLRSKSTAAPKKQPLSVPSSARTLSFSADGIPGQHADGTARSIASGVVPLRSQGMRTMSLGFAQGRQRKLPRSGSVDIH